MEIFYMGFFYGPVAVALKRLVKLRILRHGTHQSLAS
jgi:hypothetical protein